MSGWDLNWCVFEKRLLFNLGHPHPPFAFCLQLVAAIVFISFGVVAAFCCAIVDGVFAARHIVSSIFFVLFSIAFLSLRDQHTNVDSQSAETFTVSLFICVCQLVPFLLLLFFTSYTHTHTHTRTSSSSSSHQIKSDSSDSQVTFLRYSFTFNRIKYILKFADS